jgi:hypothetical protein
VPTLTVRPRVNWTRVRSVPELATVLLWLRLWAQGLGGRLVRDTCRLSGFRPPVRWLGKTAEAHR